MNRPEMGEVSRTGWMFDTIPEPDKPLPARIGHMYVTFGRRLGHHCRDCSHFCRVRYHDKIYFKCDLTEWTHGPGSDWRALWEACGAFKETDG